MNSYSISSQESGNAFSSPGEGEGEGKRNRKTRALTALLSATALGVFLEGCSSGAGRASAPASNAPSSAKSAASPETETSPLLSDVTLEVPPSQSDISSAEVGLVVETATAAETNTDTPSFFATAEADIFVGNADTNTVSYESAVARVEIGLQEASSNYGSFAEGDTYKDIANLVGSKYSDSFWGDTGSNRLDGRAGNDQLHGFAGADILLGGEGNDFLDGGRGADLLDGGQGVDYADYRSAKEGVRVSLAVEGSQRDFDGNHGFDANGNEALGDRLVNIEHLFGSAHADWLTGDAGANLLFGGKGNDRLEGGAGADNLYGGAGDDILVGGAGMDEYFFDADSGLDTIEGDADGGYVYFKHATNPADIILNRAESGDVVLTFGENSVTIKPSANAESHYIIYGGNGEKLNEFSLGSVDETLPDNSEDPLPLPDADTDEDEELEESETLSDTDDGSESRSSRSIVGSDDSDSLHGSNLDDTIFGLGGNDYIYGYSGDDEIHGGAGRDTLYGDAGDDTIYGGEGRDFIRGRDGDDTLYGDEGIDTIDGGTGDDIIYGGADRDQLTGSSGNDELYGGDDDDTLFGVDGDDYLYGGAGEDTLSGGRGKNYLEGGDGEDTYRFSATKNINRLEDDGGNVVFWQGLNGGIIARVSDSESDLQEKHNDYTGATYTLDRGEGSFDVATLTVTGRDGDTLNVIEFTNDPLSGFNFYLRLVGGDYEEIPTDSFILLSGGEEGSESSPFLATDSGDTFTGSEGRDWASYVGSNEEVSIDLGSSPAAVSGGWAHGDRLEGIRNLIGSRLDDRLRGDGGANTLRGGEGEDYLYGGDGDDRLEGGVNSDQLHGEGGNDFLLGGLSNDRLYGEDGNDRLFGGDGRDTLRGGAGDDALHGGADRDFLYGGAGADYLDGGEGASDFASYSDSEKGVRVSLGRVTGQIDFDGAASNNNDAVGDRLLNIENIRGSAYGDWLRGDQKENFLEGREGDDRLNGGAGDDDLLGGRGSDALYGDEGDDLILAGWDDDNLHGGEGADYLYGGRGADTLYGGTGADTLYGDEGTDTYVFEAYDGTDTVIDNGGKIVFLQGDVNDYAGATYAFSRNDEENSLFVTLTVSKDGHTLNVVEFLNYPSSLYIFSTRDTYGVDTEISVDPLVFPPRGSEGSESNPFLATKGADTFVGSEGADWVSYSESSYAVGVDLGIDPADIARGWSSGDKLMGINNLIGSHGSDKLYGNSADNILRGGQGYDILNGREGADILNGGEGDDGGNTATYHESALGVRVNLLLQGDGQSQQDFDGRHGFSANGNEAVGDVLSEISSIWGSAHDDWLTGDDKIWGPDDPFYNPASHQHVVLNVLYGRGGNDRIEGGAGQDSVNGGEGNDHLYGGDGNDNVRGDEGEDTAYGEAGDDYISGGAGNDILYGGAGNDRIFGGAGADVFDGGQGEDTAAYFDLDEGVRVNLLLQGEGQQDFDGSHGFVANTNGAVGDILANIENLEGSEYDDWLTGDRNDNKLLGKEGADRLEGGAGSDTYIIDIGDGADTIVDDVGDTLTLRFRSANYGNAFIDDDFTESSANFARVGDNLEITLDKDASDAISDKITILDAYDTDPNTGTGFSAFTINIEYGVDGQLSEIANDFWHTLT